MILSLSRTTAVVLVASVGLAAASCSSGSGSASSTTPKNTTTTSILPPEVVTPTTIINGQSVTVPTEQPGHAISPVGETGGQVIITPKGILPYRLFANLNQTVTFTNLTSKPVSLKTDFFKYFSTGEIQPGQSFSWSSPTSVSIGYTSSNGFKGLLIIGAFPQ